MRTARRAASDMNYTIQFPETFAAGANGPDSFFCFEIWKGAAKRRWNLPGLGHSMHENRTGAFLRSLCRHAGHQAEREYTLGFLCHYAVDTVMHPFICAMCEPGMPYDGPGGHGYLEIALDSALHKEDTGDPCIPPRDTSPIPPAEELFVIASLLHTCLLEIFGYDIPIEYLSDSFRHTYYVRALFKSRFGIRRALFGILERFMGGKGFITGHVSPAKLYPNLPEEWIDPFSGARREGGVASLLNTSQKRCAEFMRAAQGLWEGTIPDETFRAAIGSMSYVQGRPTEESAAE